MYDLEVFMQADNVKSQIEKFLESNSMYTLSFGRNFEEKILDDITIVATSW